MKIETKFDFGEKVWCMNNNRCRTGVIESILLSIRQHKDYDSNRIETNETYTVSLGDVTLMGISPHELFRNKEELLKTL